MLFILVFILFNSAFFSYAFDYTSDVKQLIEYMKHIQVNTINFEPNSLFGCLGDEIKHVKEYEILVFVSFSMPDQSLIQLSQDADKYNARLIMRGVYKNSFAELKKKVLSISRRGILFDIDPELFKQYNVQQVPTFVYVKDGSKITGNVNLAFVAEKFHLLSRSKK